MEPKSVKWALDKIDESLGRAKYIEDATKGEKTKAPFAFIVGSGFSYGIIPLASEIVRECVPLWFEAKHNEQEYKKLRKKYKNDHEGLKSIAGKFWENFVDENKERNRGEDKFDIVLDNDNLPTDYGQAYMAVFDSECFEGLGTPALARKFQQALMKRDKLEINAAHFLLASIIEAQPFERKITREDGTKEDERVKLCDLILTTNFDPLLQIALQWMNQLYYMSDTPDLDLDLDMAGVLTEAIHLVYVHGSVHRRSQMASGGGIDEIKRKHAGMLRSALQGRGVIVLGYSGWDDVIVEALSQCTSFGYGLFWCELKSVKPKKLAPKVQEILSKEGCHFIQIENGDDFMKELYLKLIGNKAKAFEDPLSLYIEQLEGLNFSGLETVQSKQSKGSTAGTETTSGYLSSEKRGSSSAQEVDDLSTDKKKAVAALKKLQPKYKEEIKKDTNEIGKDATEELRKMFAQAVTAANLGKYDNAINIYSELLKKPDLTPEQASSIRLNRGVIYGQRNEDGDSLLELVDYTRVIDMDGAPVEQVVKALNYRGITYGQRNEDGDLELELADYTRVIDMNGASAEQIADALNNRGAIYGQRSKNDDLELALKDFTRVIEMRGASVEQIADALYNRGITYSRRGKDGDLELKLADYTRVIDMDGVSVEQTAKALNNRGVIYGQRSENDDLELALEDFTRIIEMVGTPIKQLADALHNRGITYSRRGKDDELELKLADYTRVIDMDGVSVEQTAKALYHRGATYVERNEDGDIELALRDFTNVIDVDGASTELITKALNYRGATYAERNEDGDLELALKDFTFVIDMDGSPVDQIAMALNNRGITYSRRRGHGDFELALKCFSRVIDMNEATPKQIANAYYSSACIHGLQKNITQCLEMLEKSVELEEKDAEPLTQKKLREDEDFDSIRDDEGFKEFYKSLPEE